MAESYRGLTIRIGGDTTKLTKALKAANQASSQTSAELRKIGQALKLDPTNLEAFNIQLGNISNQASNTAMRLTQLRDAQRKLEESTITVGKTKGENGWESERRSLEEAVRMAREADGLMDGEVLNVGQHLGTATAVANRLAESLASAHNEVTALVADAAKIEQLKLRDALDIATGIKDAESDAAELRKQFEKMPDGTERTKEQVDAIIASIKEMASAISGTFDLDTGEFDTEAFEQVIRQLSEEMPEGVSISEQAIKRLVKSFSDAAKAAEKAKDAAAKASLPDGTLPDDKLTDEQKAKVADLQAERDKVTAKERQNQESLREAISETVSEAKAKYDELAAENEKDLRLIEELQRSIGDAESQAPVKVDSGELDELKSELKEAEQAYETLKQKSQSATSQLGSGFDSAASSMSESMGEATKSMYSSLDVAIAHYKRNLSSLADEAHHFYDEFTELQSGYEDGDEYFDNDGAIAELEDLEKRATHAFAEIAAERSRLVRFDVSDIVDDFEKQTDALVKESAAELDSIEAKKLRIAAIREERSAIESLANTIKKTLSDEFSYDDFDAGKFSFTNDNVDYVAGLEDSDIKTLIDEILAKSRSLANEEKALLSEVAEAESEVAKAEGASIEAKRQRIAGIQRQRAEEKKAHEERLAELRAEKAFRDADEYSWSEDKYAVDEDIKAEQKEWTSTRRKLAEEEKRLTREVHESGAQTIAEEEAAYHALSDAIRESIDSLDETHKDTIGELTKKIGELRAAERDIKSSIESNENREIDNEDDEYYQGVARRNLNRELAENEQKLADARRELSEEQEGLDRRRAELESQYAAQRAKEDAEIAAKRQGYSRQEIADAEQLAAEQQRVNDLKSEIAEKEAAAQKQAAADDGQLEAARKVEEIKGRIADREKQMASTVEGADDRIAGTMEKMEESSKAAADNVSRIDEEIKSAKTQTVDFGKVLVESFSGVDEKIGKLVSDIFNADNGNVDPEHIREALMGIAEEAGLGEDKINALVDDVKRLSDEFVKADTEQKKWLKITEFEDLLNEIVKGEAQLTNFSKVLSDIKVPSELLRGMSELTANSKYLSESYGRLMSTGGSLDAAFKADPTNVDAIEAAMRSYAAAALVAEENSERLAQQIRSFEDSGIERLDGGLQSAEQALLDAGKAAEEAHQRYSELDGKLAAVKLRIAELDDERAQSVTDDRVSKQYEKDQAIVKALKEDEARLTEQRDEAQQAARDADTAEELAKEHVEYERLIADAAQLRSEVTKAKEAAAASARQQMSFEMVGDLSEIDRLGNDLTAAANRAKTLSDALEFDPNNVDLLNAKTKAYEETAAIAAKRTELINAALGKLDAGAVDRVRQKYASVEEAVRKTTKATVESEAAYKKAAAALTDMLNGTEWQGMEQEILEAGDATDSLSQDIAEQRDRVLELRSAWLQNRDAMEDAMNASLVTDLTSRLAVTDLTSRLADTGKTKTANVDQAAFQQALQQVGQYAEQAGRKVIESANTIDSAYRDMRKTVQGTEEEFEKLHDAAVAFSQTHAVSADTILEMESLGGQLGVTADKLQEFGEVASNLDIATDMDAEDIALKMGQLTNVMGDLDFDTFQQFADALVRLGNNTATTESAIMNVAQRMSSVANVTSMTTPQLLAWSAAIASTGQRSESAATAINNTITGIGAAVSEGGNTLQQFAAIAGMSAEEFENAWKTSSSDALEAFIKGLQGLTDDSTAAIAALDAVGISSVRQETALLGLSQTVKNLDDAITMSDDAFNGISDTWGDAGDAAREAQNKSEGFSGSLKILQNNATDLAASLGDSLVPVMNVVSVALQGLTQFINSMPEPLRAAVVAIGGTTIALGTLLPVIKQVQEGWKAMAASMAAGKVAQALSGDAVSAGASLKDLVSLFVQSKAAGLSFGQAMGNVGAQMNGLVGLFIQSRSAGLSFGDSVGNVVAQLTTATGAANGFGAAISSVASGAVMAAGIGAVVAVVGTLASEIAGAVDRANRLSEAKEKLAKASDNLADSARGAAAAQKEVSSATYDARKDIEDTIAYVEKLAEEQDRLAESAKQRNLDYQTQAAVINEARAAIDQYANSSGLSYSAQASLATAVATLNKELGTNYEVADAVNGVIREQGSDAAVTKESIGTLVDEHLRMAEAEGIYENIKEETKSLLDIENQIAEQEAKKNELLEKSAEGYEYNATRINEVSSASSVNAAELGQMNERLEEARLKRDELSASLDENKRRYSELAGDAVDASQKEADGIASMVSSMDVFSSAFARTGRSSADFGRQIASLNGTTESFGALTQAQLAAIAQAYDGSINSIKQALSSLGITFKAAMSEAGDGSAPKVAKPDDAAVTAYQRELDDAYDAAKKAADDFQKSEQKRLDKEVKQRQKELDAEYKARQKELDAEYKAAQKASQKYLKSYKEAQSEQVEAFKNATDERVKELEREHDYKKQLLEEEYAMYDSRYDEQIAAIEAEQDAEDKAQEQRERSEKLTELQYAVDTAKSAKKREEAEKALADYKEELAAKDRKTSRQNQIQAIKDAKSSLKDQLTDRESHLKETYSLAVEQYKAERAAIQKEMTKANEIEYEQVQEAEQAKLEAMKEGHSAELEALKEANSNELDAMKEANSEYLDGIKSDADQALKELKRAHEDALKHFKETGQKFGEAAAENAKEAAKISEAVKAAEDQVDRSASGIIKRLGDSGAISLQTYTGAMNQLPWAIRGIFDEVGLTVDSGLGEVARKMLEKGDISLKQYLDIMNGMPGSLRAICNQTGLEIADELGLIDPVIAAAANKNHASIVGPMESATTKVKGNVSEINAAVTGMYGEEATATPKANAQAFADYLAEKSGTVVSSTQGTKDAVNAEIAGIASQDAVDAAGANMGVFHATITAGAENARAAAEGGVRGSNEALSMIGAGGVAKDVADNLLGVVDAGKGVLDGGKQAYETGGGNLIASIANGASGRTDDIANAVKASVGSAAAKADGESREGAATVGRNFDVGIANGINENTSFIATAAANAAAAALSAANARLKIHSPSREAAKIGRFFDLGIAQGVRLNAGEVEDAASGIGDAMTGAFDPSSLRVNTDFMQSLIDDMRARENDLRAQAERMTRIVEDGFDPHVTLDAAFDAIGRIEAGRLRREQAVASKQTVDNSTYAPVMNFTINATIREEADIELLSQRIATNVRRELSSRIG